MPTKYNAKKVILDGYTFDSTAESLYYQLLLKQKAEGLILNFELQPKFTIQAKFEKYGRKHQQIQYVGDFAIAHHDGTIEVVDVKGMATATATMKRKMFDFAYPDIELTWVVRNIKWGDPDGWVDYDELKKIRAIGKKVKNA